MTSPTSNLLSEDEKLNELFAKVPCIACDGSGAYQVNEEDVEQCQYCYELRFPFIEEATQAIKTLLVEARTEEVSNFDVDQGTVYRIKQLEQLNLEGNQP